eukprot:ANDGO_04561.mRNA.1 hypothetical protein
MDAFYWVDLAVGVLYGGGAFVLVVLLLLRKICRGSHSHRKQVSALLLIFTFGLRCFCFVPYDDTLASQKWIIAMIHVASLSFFASLVPLVLFWKKTYRIFSFDPLESVSLITQQSIYEQRSDSKLFAFALAISAVLGLGVIAFTVVSVFPLHWLFLGVSLSLLLIALVYLVIIARSCTKLRSLLEVSNHADAIEDLAGRALLISFLLFLKVLCLSLFLVLYWFARCSACVGSPILYGVFLLMHFVIPEIIGAWQVVRSTSIQGTPAGVAQFYAYPYRSITTRAADITRLPP